MTFDEWVDKYFTLGKHLTREMLEPAYTELSNYEYRKGYQDGFAEAKDIFFYRAD